MRREKERKKNKFRNYSLIDFYFHSPPFFCVFTVQFSVPFILFCRLSLNVLHFVGRLGPSDSPSIRPSICPSVHLSVRPSVHPFIFQFLLHTRALTSKNPLYPRAISFFVPIQFKITFLQRSIWTTFENKFNNKRKRRENI